MCSLAGQVGSGLGVWARTRAQGHWEEVRDNGYASQGKPRTSLTQELCCLHSKPGSTLA